MLKIPSLLRWILVSLAFALTACSTCLTCERVINKSTDPTIGSITKISSYHGVISKLAVFVVEPKSFSNVPFMGMGGNTQSAISGRSAMTNTATVFKGAFARYLDEHGLPSELISSNNNTDVSTINPPTGSTHLLLLVPESARTQCHSGCQSTVEIHAMLRDLSTKLVVWDAYLSVTEGSVFSHINADDAEKSAALLLENLRKSKLAPG